MYVLHILHIHSTPIYISNINDRKLIRWFWEHIHIIWTEWVFIEDEVNMHQATNQHCCQSTGNPLTKLSTDATNLCSLIPTIASPAPPPPPPPPQPVPISPLYSCPISFHSTISRQCHYAPLPPRNSQTNNLFGGQEFNILRWLKNQLSWNPNCYP